MADDHEHVYELKIGVDEIDGGGADTFVAGHITGSRYFHSYAECKCGAELDAEEIEEIINAKR